MKTCGCGAGMIACAGVAALTVFAASAGAQVRLEVRIIERTGQTVASPADPLMFFSVQARITGSTTALLQYTGFDIRLQGEQIGSGQLARAVINNSDGTYSSAFATSAPGTVSGVAAQYRYLGANLNSLFLGQIRTQSPVGFDSIAIYPGGDWLTNVPGLFTTDPTTNDPVAPPGGLIPQAVGDAYFGGRGNWVDIFRFRYLVTNFSNRSVSVQFDRFTEAGLMTSVTNTAGVWGTTGLSGASGMVPASSTTLTGATFTVIPTPATGGLLAPLSLLMIRTRRR